MKQQPTVKPTIMIVDDEPLNIDILSNILEKDYRLIAATNGRDALARVDQPYKPDLILLDVMMPEMDGYEVCLQLKRDPVSREIPVIFVTAASSYEDETYGLSIGAVDYIRKPIFEAVVLNRIKNHLELAKSRQQLREENNSLQSSLLHHQKKYEILFHSLPDGVLIMDMAGCIRMANAQASDIFEIQNEVLIGLSLESLIEEIVIHRLAEEGKKRLVLNKSELGVSPFYNYDAPNGSQKKLDIHMSLIGFQSDQFAIVMVSDISEKVFLQQELQLATKVEAMNQLIAKLAKEFEVTLAKARLKVDTMTSNPLDSINEEVQSLKLLLEDSYFLNQKMLQATDTKQQSLEEIEMLSFLEMAYDLLQHSLSPGVTLIKQISEPLPSIRLDSSEMMNLLINLVTNANEAMDGSGEIYLTVSQTYLSEDYLVRGQLPLVEGAYLLLEVADNGRGMSQAILDRVYEPFFTTKYERHAGLGLSRVYGFMKQIEGHVRIYSEEGEGTNVQLYFPVLVDLLGGEYESDRNRSIA